ncbi:MAG: citrate synthase [Clostridia bacterium]|nr:citrate synthase [Clostridia bacterium]
MSIIESKVNQEQYDIFETSLHNSYFIDPKLFSKYDIKKGLRNADGTGVMAGLTKVSSVEGYVIYDGEKLPQEGKLYYRGINLNNLVEACIAESRFGFEEIAYLLLFGNLPDKEELARFSGVLSDSRELPEDFTEDMIMKAPSANVMNKMARSVLALYSFDKDPDNLDAPNVMRQCIQLIAQLPVIMAYAYQVKRRTFYHKSMYLHPLVPGLSTAETILRSIRSTKKYTPEEARLLDLCLMLHADHGGGNNSTFATRVITSSGADTYASIASGISALKGPKHGGANIKVSEMVSMMLDTIDDPDNDAEVKDFLADVITKKAGDGSGLIYGMGHAVYTKSDPRAVILSSKAGEFSEGTEFEREYRALAAIERLTPEVFATIKGSDKAMCANVDLYSGLVYKMLRIPEDLYTPVFTCARIAGWSAHRIEELLTGGRIIRPAYKNVGESRNYVPISER